MEVLAAVAAAATAAAAAREVHDTAEYSLKSLWLSHMTSGGLLATPVSTAGSLRHHSSSECLHVPVLLAQGVAVLVLLCCPGTQLLLLQLLLEQIPRGSQLMSP